MGYTLGMKTAISIPEEVFRHAEALARHLSISRSQLYSRAISEYVSRHAPDRVTDALDRVCGEIDEKTDRFVAEASRRILELTEW
jgi:predicted transcriptional regulator